MIWLNILAIIGRVIFGLCIIGFVLGSLLWHKHTIFENILESGKLRDYLNGTYMYKEKE